MDEKKSHLREVSRVRWAKNKRKNGVLGNPAPPPHRARRLVLNQSTI
jgi:hypothetical protein